MKTSTKAALLALAAALVDDREAQDQLQIYGRLGEHVADAVLDLIADDNETLAGWS